MATEKISGFDIKSYEAIDPRTTVADQTARLALAYPYAGLRVLQADTGQVYKYIGTPPSNVAGDWERIPDFRFGSGVPAGTLGAIDDYYINTDNNYFYQKTAASTWTLLTDFTGAQIFQGTTVPDNGTGVDGDLYLRSNGDFYQKSAGSWGSVLFNLAGADGADGDRYSTTSSTSASIPTTHPTAVNLTVETGLAYSVGQNVVAAEDATNYFEGEVSGYNSGTGVLSINSTANTGTGSAPTTAWTVNLNTAAGQEGAAGKPGVPDKTYTGDVNYTFNEAEVTAIEADSQWTTTNLFIAYVLVDSRSNVNSPAGITGSMAGNIITWNGTAWTNKGRIRGYDGSPGNTGWSPVFSLVDRTTDESVYKLTSWQGGTGSLPASLAALVGYYVGPAGFTSNISLASNVKGPQGIQGDPGDLVSVRSKIVGGTNIHFGDVVHTPSTPSKLFSPEEYVFWSVPVGTFFNFATCPPVALTANDEIFIEAETSVLVDISNTTNTTYYSLVYATLLASSDSTFTTTNSPYGKIQLATTSFRAYNPGTRSFTVKTGFKVPISANWAFRLHLVPGRYPVRASQYASGIRYIVSLLNKGGQ